MIRACRRLLVVSLALLLPGRPAPAAAERGPRRRVRVAAHLLALRIDGYFFRDIDRVPALQGLPLTWPSPDPVLMSFETGEVPID